MKVRLSQGMMDYARWAEAELIKATPRPTYTKLQAPNANYTGAVGELGVAYMFHKLQKEGYFSPRYDGRSDHGDMFVSVKKEMFPLDVKTASDAKHQFLMVPKAQFDMPGRDYTYIGCRLDNDMLEVLGYARPTDLIEADTSTRMSLKLKIPTMLIELSSLRPLSDMLAMIDGGNFKIDLPVQERLRF